MKCFFYSSIFALLFFVAANVNAQSTCAKQYVLFEHFTNTSCGPCAVYNPVFQEDVLDRNDGTVHHISYHPWWPGNDDPFYQFNISENRNRTQYYGVSSVPRMVLMGNHWQGSSGSASWSQVEEETQGGSPIRILATETTSGNTRNVHVEIQAVGAPPSGSYTLRCAVIEREITTATPPGTNGETYFPNVFRKLINGVGGKGTLLPSEGQTKSFDFQYTLDPSWNPDEIYVVAFLQNLSTKEVINSGATINPGFELISCGESLVKEVSLGNTTSFNSRLVNISNGDTDVKITIEADAPVGWDASFEINGQSYTQPTTITLADKFDDDLNVMVNTASTAGIGKYTIKVESATNSDFLPQSFTYIVVSDVKTLVVNNDEPFANGKNYDWSDLYLDGLANANASSYGEISSTNFASIASSGGLQSVDNIFYNAGWTIPPFTSQTVDALQSFLDNSGRLFISGQDIAWACMDNSSNYTTLKNKILLNTYLGADYVADGNLLNNAIFPAENDYVYGRLSSASLTDKYGSGMYPDVVEVSAEASSSANIMYYYDAGNTKGAAIRNETANYKTVYLGFGIEQVMNEEDQNEIMDITYQWFEGTLTGAEFDKKMAELIKAYPNPASDYIRFELPENSGAEQVKVFDMTGKVISTNALNLNSSLSLENYESGFYLYEINNGKGELLKSGKFTVTK